MKPLLAVYFDGGCDPNPGGDPRYGWHIMFQDEELERGHGMAEDRYPRTNNTAEFSGCLAAVRAIAEYDEREVVVRGDSRLVIDAINKNWQMRRSPHLVALADSMT